MILSICAKKNLWLTQLLKNMKYIKYFEIEFNQVFIIENIKHKNQFLIQFLNNNQIINFLIKNAHIHERLKHIDVVYHHVRNLYNKNLIKLNYVSSANIIADDLTKSLSKNKFKKFVTQLKLRKLKINENQLNWLMNQSSSSLNENVEKNNEICCDFNSEIKFDWIKFHEHSLEMFRKSWLIKYRKH